MERPPRKPKHPHSPNKLTKAEFDKMFPLLKRELTISGVTFSEDDIRGIIMNKINERIERRPLDKSYIIEILRQIIDEPINYAQADEDNIRVEEFINEYATELYQSKTNIFGEGIHKYEISKKQRQIAKKIGVHIFPSDKPKYKIDVYDNEGLYYCSVGSSKFNDYFTYLKSDGKAYADNRKRLYLIRHKDELLSLGSRGWFAAKLLWDY